MKRLYYFVIQTWRALGKSASAFIDHFQPAGRVELILRYADGPKKGQVYRRLQGRNVVTSWLAASPNVPPMGGRDLMRRLLIKRLSDGGFSGGRGGDANATLYEMELGTGNTAETSADTALDTKITSSEKAISSVEFDATSPYVTVVSVWDETEVNTTGIVEVGLKSENGDFVARKTFGAFNKTSDFTLEVRWTIKF